MIEIKETTNFKQLAEMNEELQTFHHLAYPAIFKPFNKKDILAFFEATLAKENVKALIAVENNKPLGYALLFIINFEENPFQYARTYVLLDQLMVLKAHRNRGIAKELVEAVVTTAKSHGIDAIELNHWTNNDVARRFFASCGFDYFNEKMVKSIK